MMTRDLGTAFVFADTASPNDSRTQLIQSVAVVVIFIPTFWSMCRRVKSGKLAPVARRTNPHSRRYLVIIASLNVVIVVFFVVGSVLAFVEGDFAFGISLLLLAGLISTFVVGIFRQGSALRKEGLPDRAPSKAQQKLSRRRRIVIRILGTATGAVLFGTVGAAANHDWGTAAAGLSMGAIGYALIWWGNAPLREQS